jgi:hypothetical protein
MLYFVRLRAHVFSSLCLSHTALLCFVTRSVISFISHLTKVSWEKPHMCTSQPRLSCFSFSFSRRSFTLAEHGTSYSTTELVPFIRLVCASITACLIITSCVEVCRGVLGGESQGVVSGIYFGHVTLFCLHRVKLYSTWDATTMLCSFPKITPINSGALWVDLLATD